MPRKKTYKEHLEDFRKIHGEKYEYPEDHSVRDANRTRINIKCPIHGDFEQTICGHKKGGCNKCGIERVTKKQTLSIEEIKERSEKVHGGFYKYPEESRDNSGKMKIICPVHGDFLQLIYNHLAGQGCPKCHHGYIGDVEEDTETFIRKANAVHNGKYSYSKTQYRNARDKVIITCPVHGDFTQKPMSHVNSQQGCAECYGNVVGNTESFIAKALEVHNGKYSYDNVKYVNCLTKVSIICKTHGEFLQIPSSHLGGSGCRECYFDSRSWCISGDRLGRDYVVYLVRIEVISKEVKFYKIGVTCQGVSVRFSGLEKHGMRYTTIKNVEMLGREAKEMEMALLQVIKSCGEYRKVKHLKGCDIGGWTECFEEDITLHNILNEFTKWEGTCYEKY